MQFKDDLLFIWNPIKWTQVLTKNPTNVYFGWESNHMAAWPSVNAIKSDAKENSCRYILETEIKPIGSNLEVIRHTPFFSRWNMKHDFDIDQPIDLLSLSSAGFPFHLMFKAVYNVKNRVIAFNVSW